MQIFYSEKVSILRVLEKLKFITHIKILKIFIALVT